MNNLPVCWTNNLLVEIPKKFNDEIETDSGIKLYQDTSYRPEHHATVQGIVKSLPLEINGDAWPKRVLIEPEVQVGDEAAFSYLTIFDLEHRDDKDEVFFEDAPISPFITQYSNKEGRKLIIRYRNDDKYDLAEVDKDKRLLDMHKGVSESVKESWLGKYRMTETNEISYNNLVEYEGNELWKVDLGHVIAVRRGDQMIPIGGNVILDIPKAERKEPEGKIILLNPNRRNKAENQNEAMIIAIGSPLKGVKAPDVKAGDFVVYDERYAEFYELWGRPVYVIKQDRLLAKTNTDAK